jgi:hypothetical protein
LSELPDDKPLSKADLEAALDHAMTRMERFVLDREIGMLSWTHGTASNRSPSPAIVLRLADFCDQARTL